MSRPAARVRPPRKGAARGCGTWRLDAHSRAGRPQMVGSSGRGGNGPSRSRSGVHRYCTRQPYCHGAGKSARSPRPIPPGHIGDAVWTQQTNCDRGSVSRETRPPRERGHVPTSAVFTVVTGWSMPPYRRPFGGAPCRSGSSMNEPLHRWSLIGSCRIWGQQPSAMSSLQLPSQELGFTDQTRIGVNPPLTHRGVVSPETSAASRSARVGVGTLRGAWFHAPVP